MTDQYMDMTVFHEMLGDEAADDQLLIALRKLRLIEEPESIVEELQTFRLGVWSGWAM